MTAKRIWIKVHKNQARSQWWPAICKDLKWKDHLEIETWAGSEISWPRVIDSLRSFTLFSKQKVLLVQETDRFSKADKTTTKLWEDLKEGPHHLLIQSENSPPKNWPFEFWESPFNEEESPRDDKAIFRWIDAIQAKNLKQALCELDLALEGGQHPLVFLQLLARHYRLGRLIQHAHQKGWRESEILKIVKVPSFVLQKWLRGPKISGREWQRIFDRCHWADFQLKSGMDAESTLKRLSFELSAQNRKSPSAAKQVLPDIKPVSLFSASFFQWA